MLPETSLELVNAILYLNPNAQCSVWEVTDINKYMGENSPIPLFGMLVDWGDLNSLQCPTEDDISKIDVDNLKESLENSRKNSRDELASKDLTILSNFQQAKKDNPFMDFTQYLDKLETLNLT